MASEPDEEQFYPPIQEDRARSLTELFDYSKTIDVIVHGLRRQYPKFGKGGVITFRKATGAKPILTDEGIDDIIIMIYSICHPGTALSNVDSKHIGRLMLILRHMGSELITGLAMNYADYEIQKPFHIATIYFLVMNLLEFAVLHPIDQGARKFLAKAVSETQTVVHKGMEEEA